MTKLLVVTVSYPYGSLTDFLEDEIEHLAATFDEIVVAPIGPVDDDAQPMPDNVRLNRRLVGLTARPRRIALAFSSATALRMLRTELARSSAPRRHPADFMRLVLAVGLAEGVRRRASGLMGPADRSVGLTVWLGPLTVGLALAGFTTVSRAHRFDVFSDQHPHHYIPLRDFAVEQAALVASVSDAGRAHLIAAIPACADRVVTRRLGITGVDGVASASTDGVVRVVSCSALIPVKRPELLVQTIARLSQDRPVQWDHFGSGPLAQSVEHAAAVLPDRVTRTLHGSSANSVVLSHYLHQPVDVFLNVSESEGLPVSMMEAASAGIPIVAPDVGGIGEIVRPETGSLVPATAGPDDFSRAIVDVATRFDAAKRADVRAWWHAHFDARANYESFASELRSIADGAVR